MLLIYLFLIALIAVAVITKKEFLAFGQTESVLVPVRVKEINSFRQLD